MQTASPMTKTHAPSNAGEASKEPARHGCPLAQVDGDRVVLLHQVDFRTGSARLDPTADIILRAVANVLIDRLEQSRARIEGHTDNAASNEQLSRARAIAVMKRLVDGGVAPERLEAVGMGSREPTESNDTLEGRRKNRRVEFRVIDW